MAVPLIHWPLAAAVGAVGGGGGGGGGFGTVGPAGGFAGVLGGVPTSPPGFHTPWQEPSQFTWLLSHHAVRVLVSQ